MGLIIRTMYNNQNWQSKCTNPGKDPNCTCFTSLVDIDSPKENDEICSGDCWEKDLCVNYRWGCTPKGRNFAKAHKGMQVYFVYKEFLGNYTLWGTTKVKDTDTVPVQSEDIFRNGFYYIHFEAFKPLQRDNWTSNLSDKQLVGSEWRQGRFRYTNQEQDRFLDKLINSDITIEQRYILSSISPKMDTINVEISHTIKNNLDKLALEEGRTIEEITREAIAEWLRSR